MVNPFAFGPDAKLTLAMCKGYGPQQKRIM